MHRAWFAIAIIVPLLLSGCGGGASYDPFAGTAERRVTVRIQNLHNSDVNVVALGPGLRHEIGMVSARAVRQASVPWSGYQDLRFQIEPIGGRRVTTSGVAVGPGERVELIVQSPVERSFIRR